MLAMFFFDREPPEAGPSRWWRRHEGRLARLPGSNSAAPPENALSGVTLSHIERQRALSDANLDRRQGGSNAATSAAEGGASTSSSSPPIFVGPSTTTTSPTPTTPSTATYSSSSTTSSSSLSGTSTDSTSYSRTFSSLWSTTRTPSAAASPTNVAGATYSLSLGGSTDAEAVYAVEVDFGHAGGSNRRRRKSRSGDGEGAGIRDSGQEPSGDMWDSGLGRNGRQEQRRMDSGPRQSGTGIAGGRAEDGSDESSSGISARKGHNAQKRAVGVQKMKLQVDLGSSDMWVATTNCSTSDCRSAPMLFDASDSIDSGVVANMTYHSGSVGGTIMWEEVKMGTMSIAYQAFIGGNRVANENLGGADFSGVLGLALPANSVISSLIPGTTSSNPDGATFLDNLFGSGSSAPSQRVFSLSLERREDVRTSSVLTIGTTSTRYCPSPCNPSYIPIINHPSLGAIGYLHWRIPLQGIMASIWSDPQRGTGQSNTTIPLGPSQVVSSRSTPIAVLDSGGVAILVGYKPFADAIYAAYGVTASSDGYYRMPCKTQLALSFNFGGQYYPAHPLDMSWPDPSDPSQTTCIGAIQYTPSLGETGDFILGSSFLKNVYSIYSYPDQSSRTTWQPGVALRSLTNASVASQDFYAVRYLRQSLAAVSSQNPSDTGTSTSNPSASASSGGGGGAVVNTTAIVAGSVVGFFVLAAAAFCAWWFFLRRKYGLAGIPPDSSHRGAGGRHQSEPSTSTIRSKKHLEALRQKSMIEGYSDYSYEGDSWTDADTGGAGGGDSIRLGWMLEVPHDRGLAGEDMRGRRAEQQGAGSRGSSLWRADGAGVGSVNSPLAQTPKSARSSSVVVVDREPEPAEARGSAGSAIQAMGESWESRSRGRDPFVEDPLGAAGGPTTPIRDASVPRSISFGAAYTDLPSPTSPTSPSAPLVPPYAQPLSGSPIRSAPRSQSRSRERGERERSRSRHDPQTMSFSMSGPFPAPIGHGHGPGLGRSASSGLGMGIGGELSPMYDIRSSDYFSVSPAGAAGGGGVGAGAARGELSGAADTSSDLQRDAGGAGESGGQGRRVPDTADGAQEGRDVTGVAM